MLIFFDLYTRFARSGSQTKVITLLSVDEQYEWLQKSILVWFSQFKTVIVRYNNEFDRVSELVSRGGLCELHIQVVYWVVFQEECDGVDNGSKRVSNRLSLTYM